jgi:hypothetical protein
LWSLQASTCGCRAKTRICYKAKGAAFLLSIMQKGGESILSVLFDDRIFGFAALF